MIHVVLIFPAATAAVAAADLSPFSFLFSFDDLTASDKDVPVATVVFSLDLSSFLNLYKIKINNNLDLIISR
jgi:hypothetical protein